MTKDIYQVELLGPACRAISERIPQSIPIAVLEFCSGPLAENPYRVGKELFGPLKGCFGARRSTYRIVYRIDEERHIIFVLDVAHRKDVYRH